MNTRGRQITAGHFLARRAATWCGPLVISLWCVSVTCTEALDLTPKRSFREQEGFKIPIVCFGGGARLVSWQPPAGWQLSGGVKTLSVIPSNVALAYAKLEVTARRIALSSAKSDAESAVQLAKAHLPGDATEVSVVGQRENPFSLNGASSKEWIFNYVSHAERFSTGVAVVDLDEKEQLALIVSARAQDFKAVHDEAIASMFTWKYID